MKQLLRRPWGVILTVLGVLVWLGVIPASWIWRPLLALLALIVIIAVFKGRIAPRGTNRR